MSTQQLLPSIRHAVSLVGTPAPTAAVSALPAAIWTRSTVVPPLAFTTAWKRRIFSSARAISGFWMCLWDGDTGTSCLCTTIYGNCQ